MSFLGGFFFIRIHLNLSIRHFLKRNCLFFRWSFGIVLWEIFTLGGTPYPTVPIEQLMDYLTHGQRMMQPNHCPTELYDLMRQCWDLSPEDRPTFVEISYRIEQIFKDNVSEVR